MMLASLAMATVAVVVHRLAFAQTSAWLLLYSAVVTPSYSFACVTRRTVACGCREHHRRIRGRIRDDNTAHHSHCTQPSTR